MRLFAYWDLGQLPQTAATVLHLKHGDAVCVYIDSNELLTVLGEGNVGRTAGFGIYGGRQGSQPTVIRHAIVAIERNVNVTPLIMFIVFSSITGFADFGEARVACIHAPLATLAWVI